MMDPEETPPTGQHDEATEALVRRAQDGDREALEALFTSHYDELRRFVRRRLGAGLRRQLEDSEDVLHSAMRGALRSLPDFRPEGEEAWLRWMGTIIANKIASKARAARAQKRGDGRARVGGTEGAGLIGATPDAVRDPAEDASLREEEDLLYRALDTLPRERRDLLVKHHIRHASLAELGEELGCSTEAVRLRVLRAEQALESAFRRLREP
jgi:RNA polymerase sigma-70 factor (ECF subfamily)